MNNTPQADTLIFDECRILRVFNYDENTGVVYMRMQCGTMKFFAAGMTCSINPGAFYHMKGRWRETKKGRVFMFSDFSTLMPNNKKMAVAFLTCKGFCKGVKKETIEKIVDTLGDNAITLIKNTPSVLDSIKGVGESTKEKIVSAIHKAEAAERTFNYLYRFGINAHDSFVLYSRYGDDTIADVCTNPYGIAEDNDNIYSFAQADNIALQNGLSAYAPFRIRAGILEAMRNAAAQEGHSYLSRAEVVRRTVNMLSRLRPNETDTDKLESVITTVIPTLIAESVLILETAENEDRIFLPQYYQAEKTVAEKLVQIASTPVKYGEMDIKALDMFSDSSISFSEEQATAINGALTSPFCVITGGPGCGKSLIMSEIVKKHLLAGNSVKLAAPTAKAADRMEELTGVPATTIQRLLGYRPFQGFLYNEESPIRSDVVIIDEFSMVDILLMKDLVSAVQPGTSFIAIGDADQLPSVGAGNVFADIINSNRFTVYRLTKTFRQAEGTSIVENARAINNGQAPHKAADFIFQWCDGDEIQQKLEDVVFKHLPNYSFIPSEQVKIITPLREGDRGSLAYSKTLREGFNPLKTEDEHSFLGFRVGDKVMQTRNNYRLGVMNGDEGVVDSFDIKARRLTVRFKDNSLVTYSRAELKDEVELSYVITVHKSQGSEYPAVVIVLPPESGAMMNKRLLYTAVTRAKKMVVIIGSKEAANMSISQYTEIRRNSTLAEKIDNAMDEALQNVAVSF